MHHLNRILLLTILINTASCSENKDPVILSLFGFILQTELSEKKSIWVIAESDTACNLTMFEMEICSAEYFKRSLLGKNRMIFDGREAKMTIWDCISTCLNESKSFRFTEEHFPEGVELISQSHLDSLQAILDSKTFADSLRRDVYRLMKSSHIYKFSKPIFFGDGDFALIHYSKVSVDEGYLVFEKKEGAWVQVHRQVYKDFENEFIIPEF